MKDVVLVEFLFEQQDSMKAADEIANLGKDFCPIDVDPRWRTPGDYTTYDSKPWFRVTGQINSETATAIKLGNPFLAEHMRVSYISEDLKNKYRR